MSRISLVLAGALAFAIPANAQPASSPARASLAALVDAAVASNPEIAAARARHQAALERPAQERSLPDPLVSAGYAAAGKPYPGAGLGKEPMANIGVMVTQEIPYPGKRGLRASIAARAAEAEAKQVEVVRLGVVSRVKQAYYRLAYATSVLEVLERNRDLLSTLLKVSEARYGVGFAAQQDVFKGQAELTLLELQRERMRQEQTTSEAALNALVGRAPGTPIGTPDRIDLPPFTIALDSLLASARARAPMLLRDETMVAGAEASVQSALRDYKPDFAVSGGYFNQGSMPATYEVRFDVVLPLQRGRRAAAVREQSALLGEARATKSATERSLEARIQEDYGAAATSARLAGLYRDALLPQVRLALESSTASYQTGAVDFLSVLTNFSSLLEAEMRYYDELSILHAAISRLEEMTGTGLVH
ncbi:MAG TPA: TolC family protein [Vicinamibacterales bacterium]|nr:TolC family protein [Vicinamibacterales bacterium]